MPLSNKTHPYYKEKSSKAATIFAIYPCGEHCYPLCFPGSPGRTPTFLPWAGAWVCVWLYLLLWLSHCFSLFLLVLLNLFVAALIFYCRNPFGFRHFYCCLSLYSFLSFLLSHILTFYDTSSWWTSPSHSPIFIIFYILPFYFLCYPPPP